MFTKFRIPLLALGCACSMAMPALALGPPTGSLYLSFSPDSRVEDLQVAPFTLFHFYLVAELDYADLGHPEWNATDGIGAIEAGIVLPSSIMLGQATFAPGNASAWLFELSDGVLNLVVPFGGTCLLAQDTPYAIAHFTGMLLEPAEDLFLAVRESKPSSVTMEGGAPAPGWVPCDYSLVYPFAEMTQLGTLAINRTQVPNDAASWGAVKALFGE